LLSKKKTKLKKKCFFGDGSPQNRFPGTQLDVSSAADQTVAIYGYCSLLAHTAVPAAAATCVPPSKGC